MDLNNKNKYIQDENIQDETEINKQHREDYEKLIEESSTNLDGFWDRNNPFVILLLLVLGVIIICGVIYYGLSFITK